MGVTTVKSNSFSIYLLKDGYDHSNSLREDTKLTEENGADALPVNAKLFVMDEAPRPVWWRGYFQIKKPLHQGLKGAVLFLPVDQRVFCLTFGHVSHNLIDTSYEYDFGMQVTLNCLDPEKIKNTDTLQPSSSMRQRTQVSSDRSLTQFDFDRDSSILKSLTGKVREEYRELIRSATGSNQLRVGTDVVSEELEEFCCSLLNIYKSNDYETHFPDLRKIVPTKDPVVVNKLDQLLLEAIKIRSEEVAIVVPDILDYRDGVFISFRGCGGSYLTDDIKLSEYENYLTERGKKISDLDIDSLKKHQIFLSNDERIQKGPTYSVYRALVFETALHNDDGVYHLAEGAWFRVEGDYIKGLKSYLDPLFVDLDLPEYSHASEGDYNDAVPKANPQFYCLDKENISPTGQTQVEPCDLVRLHNHRVEMYHIKRSTLSASMSHLLNQGINSIDLLRSEPESMEKLKGLLTKKFGGSLPNAWAEALEDGRIDVYFGVVTHKPSIRKSINFPIFTRISLCRIMKELKTRNINQSIGFIPDNSAALGLRKKKNKKSA